MKIVAFSNLVPTANDLIPVSLNSLPQHRSTVSVSKRSIDVVGSIVGLCILALVFIPIALAIKLDSKGSILYVQKRFGLRGQPFYICKFRSMVENADLLKDQVPNEAQGLVFKNKHDPRVTRVGRFLRRTSLDELPQFWNVLRGEMSLVGTRPPTEDEVTQYESHHWQRLNVKPGLTGEWQVSGRSEIHDFEQILKLDFQYQAKWTPLYDLQIIGKTLWIVFDRRGAY
ncbi:sugar transferase [Cyanobacteria bacterium FACHB-DQ100]|uniref:sugar transferase n=1 Tax=Leptolyngbya sp. DQ-M1 TaxID=2933920 RepID=UPI0019AD3DB8|nr:sugar transferase [Cyanobacteria bacterium FACHB-DQ100]